jgi:putative transposase
VLSLPAKGLTTGEVSAHLAEVYGASVSKDTISTITDRVLDGMAEWQSRPLDRVYPVIFIDCIHVKIREGNVTNRPIYLALGVTVNGERDILGLRAGEHGDGEGAKPGPVGSPVEFSASAALKSPSAAAASDIFCTDSYSWMKEVELSP